MTASSKIDLIIATTDWEQMRSELMKLTMGELKAIAKGEGITLGYSAARKNATVDEIVAWRRNREREGR